MIDKERLARMAAGCGLELSGVQLEQLDAYAALLLEWNQKINLTAVTQLAEVEEKHFIDSMLPAALVQIRGKVIDVGSGAGFPGMALKILNPRLDITLMEPTGKRADFLRVLAQRLALEVQVMKERAEEAARKRWRDSFEVAIARAVAALPALCEYCLPLVKPGGLFVAMKGPDAGAAEAERARALLGGAAPRQIEYTLPGGARRSLVLITKEAPTPKAYPRAGGVIAKRPL